jgi:signal recognition particle subunit SRP54
MTPKERRNPDLLKASRKRRVAAGSGVKVEEINKLLKQHRQMADLMKSVKGKGGMGGGMIGKAAQMLGMGGGMQMPSQEELQKLQEKLGAGAPGLGGPGVGAQKPGALPDAPPPELFSQKPTLPGLGPGGLGAGSLLKGLNPFGKKK